MIKHNSLNTSIIIPALNEEHNISDLLPYIKKNYPTCEIIIVDSGFEYNLGTTNRYLQFISWYSNRKNRLFNCIYGDMGIFVRKDIFNQLDGFPESHLMEDFEFSRRLKNDSQLLQNALLIFSEVTKQEYESFDRSQKIAYMINAYNIYTIKGIVKEPEQILSTSIFPKINRQNCERISLKSDIFPMTGA